MHDDPRPQAKSGDADPVETVLADCLGLPVAEVPDAVARACRAHPALAAEIRERFELLQASGLLGERSSGDGAAPPT